MKIRAVRLREVGCFSAPIALEGFSGELDVLAGPNELGKSTILRGLQFLFTTRHTAQSKPIERLRPYAGGAPLIEADFEIEGRLWRLRKQFLSERHAVLTDLTADKVVARGEDAHRRTLELIGGAGGDHRMGLLWLEQGMSLQPTIPREAEREQLAYAIEREIAAASGGGAELRVVREQVIQQRRMLVTDHKPPRPTGAYASATAAFREANEALERARENGRAAADRLDRAHALRKRRAILADPASRTSAREHIQKLTSDREAALAARQQLKIAEANIQACESRLKVAERAYGTLKDQLAEVGNLEAVASAGAGAERELTEQLESIAKSLDEALSRREELRTAVEVERQRLQQRQEMDRRHQAAARLAEVSIRLAEAQEAAQRADEIRAWLRQERVTEVRVAGAEREVTSIGMLEARISAQLPKVRIAYQPGGAGRIRVGGDSLIDGTVLTPASTLVLDIEGIGTIAIDPALPESIGDDQSDLQAHRSVLVDLLAAMDVPDLQTARDRLEERQRLERELVQADDRVATRAPEGIARLAEEAERLAEQAKVGDDQDASLPEQPQIKAELEQLGRELREAEKSSDRLGQDHARAREHLARSGAERRAREQRLAALDSILPPPEERRQRLAELEAGLALVRDAVNNAIRERGAWREIAPDEDAMRGLETQLAEARQKEQNSADELARVEKDLAVLERELERDQQDGIAAEVEELLESVRSLGEQVRHFEREVEALNLLIETLADVERESRDHYFAPVLERLDPYMDLVFPGAKVGMGQDLDVEAMTRGGASELLSALSDGTQEQIAVLVRLAFARLLTDAGRPTPLILDDALVYSDDARIESLFCALRHAATAHQVIVFTCRLRTFEQLGGTQLTVRPWAVQ